MSSDTLTEKTTGLRAGDLITLDRNKQTITAKRPTENPEKSKKISFPGIDNSRNHAKMQIDTELSKDMIFGDGGGLCVHDLFKIMLKILDLEAELQNEPKKSASIEVWLLVEPK